jgi:exodeoxyribonuclease V alpha subunit
VIASVERLLAANLIGPFAAELGDRLARIAGAHGEWAALAAVAASEASSAGNVCIDLLSAHARIVDEWRCQLPAVDVWRAGLRASGIVVPEGEYGPLVLDDADQLYLYRFWYYERTLASAWLARGAEESAPVADADRVRDALHRWFPQDAAQPSQDEQRRAAAIALSKRFCVIAGGPGTGKTTTAARILAMLAELSTSPLRIAMAAPTGKAALRLEAAMRDARARLVIPDTVAQQLPTTGQTIHRLLGPIRNSVRFRHDHDSPLPIDCLLVDEASMVDLPLMTKLVRALPASARLILLGDYHQLASVEAGAVMASLMAGPQGYRQVFADDMQRFAALTLPVGDHDSALADARVSLTHSHRFDHAGGVGALARAVLAGDEGGMHQHLVRLGPTPARSNAAKQLDEAILRGFADYVAAVREGRPLAMVFAAFHRFRILCVHRKGMAGVDELNRRVESLLRPLLPSAVGGTREWYPGRAVMMRRNDYTLDLYNGDLGIVLGDPSGGGVESGALRVFFEGNATRATGLAPTRVSDCETAFAITVHKSQGSEFEEVVIVLPGDTSPLVTRELLYTAVTRARSAVRVVGEAEAFVRGALSPQRRTSGLAAKLWGKGA